MSRERSAALAVEPKIWNDGLPIGRAPIIPAWYEAWVKGDRMMPVATPANITLGLAVLRSIKDQSGTMKAFVQSGFDDTQIQTEIADAVIFHNRFGIPVKPKGYAGPRETAYNPRKKADFVYSGTKANILSTIYELSLGNEGRNRRHDPMVILDDVELFLEDDNNLDITTVLFESAANSLDTPSANLAKGTLLKSMNYKVLGKPSEPVTQEQKTTLLTALTPVVAEHILAVGRDLEIPDIQLRTFVVNVLNTNFEGEKLEEISVTL